LIILTKTALEIAVIEKNITDAMVPGKDGFFSLMQTNGGNRDFVGDLAIPERSINTIGMTLPRTERTMCEGISKIAVIPHQSLKGDIWIRRSLHI
jgi:hypothetical protein